MISIACLAWGTPKSGMILYLRLLCKSSWQVRQLCAHLADVSMRAAAQFCVIAVREYMSNTKDNAQTTTTTTHATTIRATQQHVQHLQQLSQDNHDSGSDSRRKSNRNVMKHQQVARARQQQVTTVAYSQAEFNQVAPVLLVLDKSKTFLDTRDIHEMKSTTRNNSCCHGSVRKDSMCLFYQLSLLRS